jgi:mono/diheme cytochrome c family protein
MTGTGLDWGIPVKRILSIAAVGILAGAGLFAVTAQTRPTREYSGRQIFELHGCVGCHLDDGSGAVGPALAGNHRLRDTPFVIDQILTGGEGMPGFGVQLTNEQVARVSTYVRNAWGNEFGEVTAPQVDRQRQGQEMGKKE